jgi:hypothetical protein
VGADECDFTVINNKIPFQEIQIDIRRKLEKKFANAGSYRTSTNTKMG